MKRSVYEYRVSAMLEAMSTLQRVQDGSRSVKIDFPRTALEENGRSIEARVLVADGPCTPAG